MKTTGHLAVSEPPRRGDRYWQLFAALPRPAVAGIMLTVLALLALAFILAGPVTGA